MSFSLFFLLKFPQMCESSVLCKIFDNKSLDVNCCFNFVKLNSNFFVGSRPAIFSLICRSGGSRWRACTFYRYKVFKSVRV